MPDACPFPGPKSWLCPNDPSRCEHCAPTRCHMPGCCYAATEIVRGELCCDRHAVLRRAGWRCEAIIADRRPWVDAFVRCPVVGSEVDAHGGEARCPRHSRGTE